MTFGRPRKLSEVELTTIDEVAAQKLLVEETVRMTDAENRRFTQLFTKQDRYPDPDWVPSVESVCSYQVPYSALDGRFRGIFTRAGFVRDTSYLMSDEEIRMLPASIHDLVWHSDSQAPVIIGCNQAYDNYYHWVTQSLPAIDFAMRRAGQARNSRIALPPLKPWQEESLRLLGHGVVERMVISKRDRLYGFNMIEFSNILTGATAFSRSKVVAETYSHLRQAVKWPRQANRNIYVARTDSSHRKMRNEMDLIHELSKRGFDILEAGKIGFAEQIATFQSATLIVGPHGAGLTNIAFCRPGTFVYELVPQQYVNVCFRNLAFLGSLRYWADEFPSEGDLNVPSCFRDWESNTSTIIERLDEIGRIRSTIG
jgi:hypothetical protein